VSLKSRLAKLEKRQAPQSGLTHWRAIDLAMGRCAPETDEERELVEQVRAFDPFWVDKELARLIAEAGAKAQRLREQPADAPSCVVK
jgi:hypothetical protein